MFARLGGGIFTKAADVGADLVGKIEAGIPEDDPRNPAVIADNVGDNVGDCAGMAADLFETYAVTAVAVMLLGVLLFSQQSAVALYPARARRGLDHRLDHRHLRRPLAGRKRRAGALSGTGRLGRAGGARVHPDHLLDDARAHADRPARAAPHWWKFYLCALIGIGVTACLFVITDYFTSTRFAPVKSTARASQTGHATNIIQGLAQGYQSTAPPAIVLALGILGAWKLAGGGTNGIYGIGVAVMAQLSLTGLIVALDAFGPITDNAGGIAEMADLPEEVRNVTDPLDAVGNTTKAVTKGYAIGSAALAALVLFNAFQRELIGRQDHQLLDRQPAGADRAADRRDDGLPVRRRSRWRRSAAPAARSSRRCAASSARSPGSWRAPSSPSTAPRSRSSPAPRSAR